MYKKLFIPGPTHVVDEILQAQAVPMIGHRMKEYSDLQAEVTPKLQELLYTRQRVYLFASSSTGVMEGAIRQASNKKSARHGMRRLFQALVRNRGGERHPQWEAGSAHRPGDHGRTGG